MKLSIRLFLSGVVLALASYVVACDWQPAPVYVDPNAPVVVPIAAPVDVYEPSTTVYPFSLFPSHTVVHHVVQTAPAPSVTHVFSSPSPSRPSTFSRPTPAPASTPKATVKVFSPSSSAYAAPKPPAVKVYTPSRSAPRPSSPIRVFRPGRR